MHAPNKMKDENSGVQGFSKVIEPSVIWAADNQHAPHEVRALLSSLDIQFTPMLGSYVMADGARVVEYSYCTSQADFDKVVDLAKGQESILVLGSKDSRNRHKATLRFMDGAPSIELGHLFSVPVLDAPLWGDAWSIPLDGKRDGAIVAFVCAEIDKFGEPVKPIRTVKADLGKAVHSAHDAMVIAVLEIRYKACCDVLGKPSNWADFTLAHACDMKRIEWAVLEMEAANFRS